jgi:hypothetical protein
MKGSKSGFKNRNISEISKAALFQRSNRNILLGIKTPPMLVIYQCSDLSITELEMG